MFIDITSDETTAVNHSGLLTQVLPNDCDNYNWRRPRSESSADAESGKCCWYWLWLLCPSGTQLLRSVVFYYKHFTLKRFQNMVIRICYLSVPVLQLPGKLSICSKLVTQTCWQQQPLSDHLGAVLKGKRSVAKRSANWKVHIFQQCLLLEWKRVTISIFHVYV